LEEIILHDLIQQNLTRKVIERQALFILTIPRVIFDDLSNRSSKLQKAAASLWMFMILIL
jgi:hypothetical protein